MEKGSFPDVEGPLSLHPLTRCIVPLFWRTHGLILHLPFVSREYDRSLWGATSGPSTACRLSSPVLAFLPLTSSQRNLFRYPSLTIMGSKKNKTKKITSQLPPIEQPPIAHDDDLMDDLFAQLDSQNQTVQAESAAVINEININSGVDDTEAKHKQDSKSRHKARMVCDHARNLRTDRCLINLLLGEESCSFSGEILPFRC